MHPITIRRANKNDVQIIRQLSWQTFFDTFHQHNTKEDMTLFLAAHFNEKTVASEVHDPCNTFLLAYLKKELVGYAKLSTNYLLPSGQEEEEHIEIARLYAVKEKIGSGVGKALMHECILLGQTLHKQAIWLGVWEHNQRAINFYRKWGFEKFGEHPFVLGNDVQNDWLMKKHLFVQGVQVPDTTVLG